MKPSLLEGPSARAPRAASAPASKAPAATQRFSARFPSFLIATVTLTFQPTLPSACRGGYFKICLLTRALRGNQPHHPVADHMAFAFTLYEISIVSPAGGTVENVTEFGPGL